jgi:hypothetical protein
MESTNFLAIHCRSLALDLGSLAFRTTLATDDFSACDGE